MSIEQKKKLTALMMADSLRQIQKRSQALLEKMSRDGIESCASANLDLLEDAKWAWTCAAKMQLLVSLSDNSEVDDADT